MTARSTRGPASWLARLGAIAGPLRSVGWSHTRSDTTARQLAAIIASTDDAVIGKTIEGQILSWNPAAQRIYGYTPAEAIGRHISFLLPPGQHDEIAGILARLTAGHHVDHLETVRRRKDGREIAVSLTISPIRDDAGRVVGASTIARDISSGRALAQQLRASEERYRSTLDHAPIGIAIVALNGRWLRANRALCEMTGYSERDLLARRSEDITHPDDREASRENTRRLLAGEIKTVESEKRYVRPDGSIVWVALKVSLVRDADGTLMHRVAQMQDITAAKRDHERLLAHAREQEALRAIATVVASEAAPRAVFAAAAEQAASALSADDAGVIRLEATGEARVVGRWSAAGLPMTAIGAPVDLDAATAVATTLRTGRLANVGTHDRHCPAPASPVAAELAAPVEVYGRLWGAVSVSWRADTAGDPQAAERIARIADLVSLAVAGADAREQLSRLASTDHLTGLHNQRAFSDHLDEEVRRARRHGRPVSLVVFDIDHFKLVNDTHGHEAGNRTLAEFAARLRAVRRDGEILARVGGEEFAWILPETDGDGAQLAAERVRRAIADLPFPGIGRVTTSAGVCALDDAGDARELFRNADLALYWAKSNGRNATFRFSAAALHLLTADEQAVRLERAKTLAAVRALAVAVDAKDPSTQRHSERVAELAAALGTAAGWAPDRVALLHDAARVHDVGKIAVPDEILLKPARLTAAEYEQVKIHSAVGAQMLDDLLCPEQVDWIRHHHERVDGSGYPDGLAGDEIPEGARLLAVADAWDAMTVARPYGAPRSASEALNELRTLSATQFCPVAAALMIALHDQGAEDRPGGQDPSWPPGESGRLGA
ncbi:MAG: PAS domain S-box protein [Solirubrobacteraceae bacterium]